MDASRTKGLHAKSGAIFRRKEAVGKTWLGAGSNQYSPHVFKKAGADDVVIPVHGGKVKPFYVRQIAKLTEGS